MFLVILSVIVLLESTEQFEYPVRAINYTRQNECEFDWMLMQEIVLYKPTIDFIMDTIHSKMIADDFYEKYSIFIDKFGPRPSGSINLERAIDHMIDLTLDSGLYDVTTEDVLVPHWRRGYESLRLILPRPRNMTLLGLGPSVPTPPRGVTGEVIVLNSFKDLDYEEQSCMGKIVLFNAPYTTYKESVKYRVHAASKAAKKGAIAVLVRSITPFSLYTPHTGSLIYEEGVKKIPAAAITVEDADFLQRVYNRNHRIVVNLKMLNSFDKKVSRNTIIELAGREYADRSVIVSGHIDSWDVGKGAIDNGGGMMISWFVPVILNYLSLRPRRTIKSILWTSEELGYNGGVSYIKRHEKELGNIDFILESDAGTFEPLGLEVVGSTNIKCLIGNILKLFAPIDLIKDANTTGSEIALFLKRGIPGATLLNKNDRYFWYHHTPADTLTAQNKTNVIACAAFWAAVSFVIADLPFEMLRN